MLYHGTPIGGLNIIKANAKSHTTGKTVAYFTEDRCYALVCCRSPNERYSEIDPAEQKQAANDIKEYKETVSEEMKKFYIEHFSSLWG